MNVSADSDEDVFNFKPLKRLKKEPGLSPSIKNVNQQQKSNNTLKSPAFQISSVLSSTNDDNSNTNSDSSGFFDISPQKNTEKIDFICFSSQQKRLQSNNQSQQQTQPASSSSSLLQKSFVDGKCELSASLNKNGNKNNFVKSKTKKNSSSKFGHEKKNLTKEERHLVSTKTTTTLLQGKLWCDIEYNTKKQQNSKNTQETSSSLSPALTFCPSCQISSAIFLKNHKNLQSWLNHISCCGLVVKNLNECPYRAKCSIQQEEHYQNFQHDSLAKLRAGLNNTNLPENSLQNEEIKFSTTEEFIKKRNNEMNIEPTTVPQGTPTKDKTRFTLNNCSQSPLQDVGIQTPKALNLDTIKHLLTSEPFKTPKKSPARSPAKFTPKKSPTRSPAKFTHKKSSAQSPAKYIPKKSPARSPAKFTPKKRTTCKSPMVNDSNQQTLMYDYTKKTLVLTPKKSPLQISRPSSSQLGTPQKQVQPTYEWESLSVRKPSPTRKDSPLLFALNQDDSLSENSMASQGPQGKTCHPFHHSHSTPGVTEKLLLPTTISSEEKSQSCDRTPCKFPAPPQSQSKTCVTALFLSDDSDDENDFVKVNAKSFTSFSDSGLNSLDAKPAKNFKSSFSDPKQTTASSNLLLEDQTKKVNKCSSTGPENISSIKIHNHPQNSEYSLNHKELFISDTSEVIKSCKPSKSIMSGISEDIDEPSKSSVMSGISEDIDEPSKSSVMSGISEDIDEPSKSSVMSGISEATKVPNTANITSLDNSSKNNKLINTKLLSPTKYHKLNFSLSNNKSTKMSSSKKGYSLKSSNAASSSSSGQMQMTSFLTCKMSKSQNSFSPWMDSTKTVDPSPDVISKPLSGVESNQKPMMDLEYFKNMFAKKSPLKKQVPVPSTTNAKPKQHTASEMQSIGTTSRNPILPMCPFYKKIPETSITVDAFKYGVIPGCRAYFLSHFHYDHYQGLSKHFKQPIYCSQVTANLVKLKIGVSSEYIHPLDLYCPVMVEGVNVTLMDANHCPGATLFLFKRKDGLIILHTGDFRADSVMEDYAALKGIKINQLYLDTTYCNSNYAFPSQAEILDLSVSISLSALRENPKTLIVVGTYTIGKEKVFLAIAEAIKSKIGVTREKKRILDCQENCHLNKLISLNLNECQVHVVKMNFLRYQSLSEHLLRYKQFNQILAFKPTGWTHSDKNESLSDIKPIINTNNIVLYGLPYSEHSSFTEMKRFVQFARPEKIIPTVNNGSASARNAMESIFKSWLSEKEKINSINNFFQKKNQIR